MKVVKLNRRFNQFREHGHTVALRFDHWSAKVSAVERLVEQRIGGKSWNRSGDWSSYFGASNGHSDRKPFWITFRRESDLTLVLLSMNLTKNS
jgi:hypothetical protein